MHRFGMMLKSYEGDLPIASRLIRSFHEYNVENLPLTVLVPAGDHALFAEFAGANIQVLSEDLLTPHLSVDAFGGMRLGYVNQQIVKLAFWELDIYDEYFVLDSDMVFVRPFHRSDFMFDEDTPFSVLVEDNDLQADPRYYHDQWISRAEHLERIKNRIGLADPRTLTCHNHQIFSSRVLRSLQEDFMGPQELSYADLLRISPYEFSWYNFWLQKSEVVPIRIREPLVKMLHHEGQHLEYAARGTTLEDIARSYVGIVVNSSFARVWPDITPQESSATTLSRYVPAAVLLSALLRKARLVPRLFGYSK